MTTNSVPASFNAHFECTNGTFVVECSLDWAPYGVQRFHELVTSGFYDENRFFRVVRSPRPFVVQFGINGNPGVMQKWRSASIPDDAVRQSNLRGTLCFAATNAPNSRTTQLFINLGDNSFLDNMRFAVIGRVSSGMEVVDAINGEYGEDPDQSRIQQTGNAYLDQYFPKLDYIRKAEVR